MIQFLLVQNRNGKTRLSRWFQNDLAPDEKQRLIQEAKFPICDYRIERRTRLRRRTRRL